MSALPVARLFGFEIRIHVSWAIILAVLVVSVVSQVETMAPGTAPEHRWLIGGVVAGAFLLSALAHELGHAIVARRAGMPGGPVIVYFFGGASSAALEARSPRDEAMAALAGPGVSLAIGTVMVAVAGLLAAPTGQGSAPVLAVVGEVALVIGVLNLLLGAVNLIPAYPLDGGRVARAVGWARTGDPTRGLRLAAAAGRWIGIGCAAAGLVVILALDVLDGTMLALCGWFLVSGARAIDRTAGIEERLEGIAVGQIMDRDVAGIPGGLTIDTFAEQLLTGPATAIPVVRDRELVGMVGLRQVRALRRDRWRATRAEDVMTDAAGLPRIAPETSVRAALALLLGSGLDGLPVHDADGLAGVVTRGAIADAIRSPLTGEGSRT